MPLKFQTILCNQKELFIAKQRGTPAQSTVVVITARRVTEEIATEPIAKQATEEIATEPIAKQATGEIATEPIAKQAAMVIVAVLVV